MDCMRQITDRTEQILPKWPTEVCEWKLDTTGPAEEIRCISAICCIPDLGLESEEVTVSVNPAGCLLQN